MSEAWSCHKGACLLIPSGPDSKKHLFALLLEPLVVPGYGTHAQVLLACVTSVKDGVPVDDACLLKEGDHPFVDHDSYVDYRFTRLERASLVEAQVQSGLFIEKAACSPDLIKRIIAGALNSRRISREHKKLLQTALFG